MAYDKSSSRSLGMGKTLEEMEELSKEDNKLLKESQGHQASCAGSCGNIFHLNCTDYTTQDCKALDKFLSEGGCPYCGGAAAVIFKKIPKPYNPYADDTLEPHTFIVGEKTFKCVRQPLTWKRFRKPRSAAQVVASVNRSTKNWVK